MRLKIKNKLGTKIIQVLGEKNKVIFEGDETAYQTWCNEMVLAMLEATPTEQEPVDLGPLKTEITTLKRKVTTLEKKLKALEETE